MAGLVEVAVGKTVAPAVARAIGWACGGLTQISKDRRLRRKFEALLNEPAPAITSVLGRLSREQAEALSKLMNSAEAEHYSLQVAIGHYLPKCGTKTYKDSALRQQLRDLIRLHLGVEGEILELVTVAVYDDVDRSVVSANKLFLGDVTKLPARTRETLIKCAASHTTALAENGTLLAALSSLTDYAEFERLLRTQIASVHGAMRLPHAGTTRLVRYDRLFVQPRITVVGVEEEDFPVRNLAELIGGSLHNVLLGNPGGGKSTASLKLVYDIASGNLDNSCGRVPFLVPLKDYAEDFAKRRTPLVDYLEILCNTPYTVVPPNGAIDYLLRNGAATVIFDGLDELLETSLRRDIVQAVEGFAYRYPTTAILVTSRKIGYEEAALDSDLFAMSSLLDFGPDEVENYARKWFSLDESIPEVQRSGLAETFLSESEYVRDLRANPLMLSLMCGLYAGEKYIPKNRPDVYEKCAVLLYERWDRQRGIVAPLPFDAHVMSSLRSLALWLYPQKQARSGLPRHELVGFMTKYLYDKRFDDYEDAESAANSFIDFCRGRAWVLTDVGAELYWFTHQTFLEYFASAQLVRENASADSLFNILWPRICLAEWDVVAQLALQGLGRAVEDGADDLIDKLVDEARECGDPDFQANVLSFVARSLEFIVPRPSVVRKIVDSCVDYHIDLPSPRPRESAQRRNSTLAVAQLWGGNAENVPLIKKYLVEALQRRCAALPPDERALALAMFWSSYVRMARIESGGTLPDTRIMQIEICRAIVEPINAATRSVPWVYAYQVEDGKESASEMVDTVGALSFYTCRFGGDVVDPPLAWKIVKFATDRAPWANPKGRLLDGRIVADIYEALIRAPAPWLDSAGDFYSPLFSLVRSSKIRPGSWEGFLKKDPRVRSVAILFMLPLFELAPNRGPGKGNSRRLKGRRAQLGDFVGRGNTRGGEDRTLAVKLLNDLQLTTDARDIVAGWLQGDVSFTTYPE